MICYDCMKQFKWLVEDKGFKVCQKCFHIRYSKKNWINENYKKVTLKDLKRHFEKRY